MMRDGIEFGIHTHTHIYIYVFILFTCVKGRSPEYEEPQDLRSNPFQGGGDDAILPPKGIGEKNPRGLG